MMLKIPPKTSKAEKEQVEAWWRRFFSGVWNSHRAKAITNTVEVETVGDSLDEMASEELTTIAREDVCAAMGVPHSLISADAANYATSQQDALNFYQQTVLPSATLIAEIINDQIMPDGYELVFHPEQLEVFQQHEVSKAQALSTLTGQPILTVDEARAMLGYEPLGAAEPEPAVDDTELDNGDDMEVLEAIKARLDDLAFWTESEGEYANGHYLDL
jgi:HK97 family phage portal protein